MSRLSVVIKMETSVGWVTCLRRASKLQHYYLTSVHDSAPPLNSAHSFQFLIWETLHDMFYHTSV